MNQPVYCCVGMKFGDCCQVISILHHEFLKTGVKPILIVTKGLLPLLDGATYIEPELFKGHWQDLKGALLWAKKKYPSVKCLSFHGANWPVHKKTPSFQLEIYDRADLLDSFPLSLVFDNRNPTREAALLTLHTKDCQPLILVADHSESSPFDQIEGLVSLLETEFGVFHQIIRLSTVKAEKPYDLLGLYDKAVCLVSIDTMHLHLSAGSSVPVIALTSDKPEMWHGTAWQSRFKAHIRYSDYEDRKAEIVEAVKGVIEQSKSLTAEDFRVDHKNGYNPSIIEHDGHGYMTYRYHPNPLFWRTQLAIRDSFNTTTQTSHIQAPDGFEEYSLEDGRLFIHKGKLHIGYVVACAPQNEFRCAMQYGELVKTDAGWKIINAFQPSWGRNDFTGTEKNHVYFSQDDKLYCIYQIYKEQIVLEIERDIIINEFRSVSPDCSFGTPRGGTQPLAHNGKWLRFFHVQDNRHNDRARAKYHVGALLMDDKPPFKVSKFSTKPILSGNERYFPSWKFWKWNVAICYGAIKQDDGFLVSAGLNDSACGLLKLSEKDLNL